jgi:hypothetical protein
MNTSYQNPFQSTIRMSSYRQKQCGSATDSVAKYTTTKKEEAVLACCVSFRSIPDSILRNIHLLHSPCRIVSAEHCSVFCSIHLGSHLNSSSTLLSNSNLYSAFCNNEKKVKAIPVTGHEGPYYFETSRLPYFV